MLRERRGLADVGQVIRNEDCSRAPSLDEILELGSLQEHGPGVREQQAMKWARPGPPVGVEGAGVAVHGELTAVHGAPQPGDEWSEHGRGDHQNS